MNFYECMCAITTQINKQGVLTIPQSSSSVSALPFLQAITTVMTMDYSISLQAQEIMEDCSFSCSSPQHTPSCCARQ